LKVNPKEADTDSIQMVFNKGEVTTVTVNACPYITSKNPEIFDVSKGIITLSSKMFTSKGA